MKNIEVIVIFTASALLLFFTIFSLIEDIRIRKNIKKVMKKHHSHKSPQKSRKILFENKK